MKSIFKISVAALLLSFTSFSIAADDLQYKSQDSQLKEAYYQIELNTKICMKDGVNAMLMNGSRDSNHIIGFITSTCGMQLIQFMTGSMSIPEKDANQVVQALAYSSLSNVPGLHYDLPPKNSLPRVT